MSGALLKSFQRAAVWTMTACAVLTGTAHAAEVTPLVSTDWLAENLADDNVLVVDIRSALAKSGKDDYLKAHIPGAVWSEYPGYWRTERDGVTGVLPSVEKLEASLSELGVHEDRTVVIVPAGTSDLDFGAAARIYWTFKYLGHEGVTILDGGHAAWAAENRALDSGNVTPEGDLFIAETDDELLISTDEVASLLGGSTILLDGRPATQFEGREKHKDAVRFGHLPGAVSFDQAQFFDQKAKRLKPLADIKATVPASLRADGSSIVSYCNTGHWAATNWFVLTQLLGQDNVTLYDESMVGWSRQKDLPMVGPDKVVATN